MNCEEASVLLHALIENPGRILSRSQLEQRLYGWGEEVESNVVEVHVHTLRRKLEAVAPAQAVIATCYGRGYRLAVPVARGVDRAEPARTAATVARFPDRRGLAAVPSRGVGAFHAS
jgi:DNA-binding winged helix-turn-helix (wHTH) protein